jgi:NADH-quinone oxidoreductase subunit L
MNLWLLLAFPLVGFLINGWASLRRQSASRSAVHAVAVGAVGLAFAYSCWIISQSWSSFAGGEASGPSYLPYVERYFTWFASGSLRVGFDLAMDRITALMLLVISGVGLLIHTYAIGYMSHDDGYARFFAYMNLFMFFMLLLVLSANFLLLFVGWEGVGLCSYLLIGYYCKEKTATDAANKAFIVNRIGDFGFLLAMMLLAVQFGSVDFVDLFAKAEAMPAEVSGGVLTGGLTAICLLLLVGAAGKSAQLPLYVWLPDAMAGPTPVSALIHAATMVTAGIYLIARSSILFDRAPFAQEVVTIVGLATAVLAALIGMAQMDIKKVFAYSTVSQLGYMFVGAGVGAYSAAMYHLMTHAFFKALLFLGAGSVIHALHGEQDLRKMGGLRSRTPVTFVTLLCAGYAISGMPFGSGYFSKDEILLAAYHHSPWMYWVGVATAGLTAFYVFRALFLTFFGEYKGDGNPHESPPVMTIPLTVLAVLSLGGGWLSAPRWLAPVFGAEAAHHDTGLMIVSVAAGFVGIATAGWLYWLRPSAAPVLAAFTGALGVLVRNRFYVDEAYDLLFVRPLLFSSRIVLGGLVDHVTIDGIVHNVLGRGVARTGGWLSQLQGGHIRSYAAWVLIGGCVLVVFGLMAGGTR